MRTSRLWLFSTLVAAATAGVASAQTPVAYATAGPAIVTGLGHRELAWLGGGGAEAKIGPLAFGGDVDYAYFAAIQRTRGAHSFESPALSAVAASAHAAYYIGEPGVLVGRFNGPRTQPFVTAGLSFLVSGEVIPMLHVGGGVDWWATRRTGVRLEVREQLGALLAVRCGIVFR